MTRGRGNGSRGRADARTRGRGEVSARLRVSASIAAVLFLAAPAVSLACSVCFGNSDSPMAKGTNNAVWVMLGIIGFVQVGFVALFLSFWRRAREIRKRRKRFRLIGGLAR